MSRCGCTTPCPACPQSTYVTHLSDEATILTIPVPSTVSSVSVNLLEQPINIPAGLPGLDAWITAEFAFSTPDDQESIVISWALFLDDVLLQSRTLFEIGSDFAESAAIIAGVENISPGNHTVILNLTLSSSAGTPELLVNGAAMVTTLVRADNLTLTDFTPTV